jgi:hypothetical protein
VNARKAGLLKKWNPLRREVHVEQDLHGSGSSVSWVRQAAYANAA